MTFLPSLRRPNPSNLIAARVKALPGSPEAKAVFTSYVGALASASGHHRARPWDIDRAIVDGYERIIWVFKPVEVISGNASRLPVKIKDGSDYLDDQDHPLLWILNHRANPLENGRQFRKRLSAQILLSKRGAFVEETTSNGGTPIRWDLLPPARTKIVPGRGSDPISHYEVIGVRGDVRVVEAERVRWFRDPHPVDPWSGITPLESAGLSVEVDYAARLYNERFLANDARPGGILGVSGPDGGPGLSQQQARNLEERFGHGPVAAGKLSVVEGKIVYVDTAARPRDIHYPELSRNAKTEILSAFGVAESLLGYAADRTFANADQELENFWLVEPMPAHLELLRAAFDDAIETHLDAEFDVSDVEPIQAAKEKKLERARAEVAAGLRSIFSYAQLAGYADDIDETPHTRALWVSSSANPMPSRVEDEAALGFSSTPAAQNGPGQAQAVNPDGTTVTQVPPALPAQDAPPAVAAGSGPPAAIEGPAARALAAIQAGAPTQTKVARPRPRGHAYLQVKDAAGTGGDTEEPHRAHTPDEAAALTLETDLSAALTAVTEGLAERALARLQSPKTRKGTRHFTAEYTADTRVGTKALDTARAVDEARWQTETTDAARPIVEAAAQQAAARAVTDLAPDQPADPGRDAAIAAVIAAVILALIGQSAARQASRFSAILNAADQAGKPIAEVIGAARAWLRPTPAAPSRLADWAQGVSIQAATAVTEGAADAAVTWLVEHGLLPRALVKRTWTTRHDDRVRPSHREADGQAVSPGTPFVVGGAVLRFPGDPLAPPAETAGCRCRVVTRVGRGRFGFTLPGAA